MIVILSLRLQLIVEATSRSLSWLRMLEVDAVPVCLVFGVIVRDLARHQWGRWPILISLLFILERQVGSDCITTLWIIFVASNVRP